MIDCKIILESTKKMLDILYGQGYIYGKVEIDFNRGTGRIKLQIHQFEKHNDETIRRTMTVVQ